MVTSQWSVNVKELKETEKNDMKREKKPPKKPR